VSELTVASLVPHKERTRKERDTVAAFRSALILRFVCATQVCGSARECDEHHRRFVTQDGKALPFLRKSFSESQRAVVIGRWREATERVVRGTFWARPHGSSSPFRDSHAESKIEVPDPTRVPPSPPTDKRPREPRPVNPRPCLGNLGARDGNRTRDIHVRKRSGQSEVTPTCVSCIARGCNGRHWGAPVTAPGSIRLRFPGTSQPAF